MIFGYKKNIIYYLYLDIIGILCTYLLKWIRIHLWGDLVEKIIFDCDNTMSLPNKDVDDGLTLMYLLGSDKIELLGVTTCFGNSTIEDIYNNTTIMFNDLDLHIPLKRGSGKGEDRVSDASKFLVEMASKYPNEITILATGSLSNLYGAYLLDNNFYNNLKEIVLMGGICKPLLILGKIVNELNFSCDPEATYNILNSGIKVTTMTGHICLQAIFRKEEYDRLMNCPNIPAYRYIKEKTYAWFEHIKEKYKSEGFCNWDIVSAMYITNPELFDDNFVSLVSTVEDLKTGFLRIDMDNHTEPKLNIPTRIKDIEEFNEIIFEAWKNVSVKW